MSAAGDDAPAVLCVDDEPNVLEGLTRHLRRHFRVSTATRGQEVTTGMRERIRNFSDHLGVKDPVLMTVPPTAAR